jgi:uncharacterized protein (DUF488 family)
VTIQIISIGYERRSIEEFISILREYGVVHLLDIRQHAASRRPDFNKQRLTNALTQADIQYSHISFAGNPFHKQVTAGRDECLAMYANHLADRPTILEMVAATWERGPIAMLCYERLHRDCHRSILLSALAEHGYDIEVVRVEDDVPALGATQDSYLGQNTAGA